MGVVWGCWVVLLASPLLPGLAERQQGGRSILTGSAGPSGVGGQARAPGWGGRAPTALRGAGPRHVRSADNSPLKPNIGYQACLTPTGAQGRCRHLQYCILQDFKINLPRMLDYMCIIERSYVGVCCPEQQQQQGVGVGAPLPPSTLAGLLPAVAGQGGQPEPEGLSKPKKPKLRGCGVGVRPSTAPSGSGGMADPGEWPWMAALLKNDDLQYCGGVLITDRHVLTASHCLINVKAEELYVRLGEYDLESSVETRSRDFRVSEIRRHENFQKATYENDIAILKLERPAIFNSYIWPVCLPPPDLDFENATAVVAGWGTLGFGAPPSDVLMEVSVPVWPQERCTPLYAQPILDNMMCAGGYDGGKDACQGDSGGPLLLQTEGGSWATIGVVSWGIRCGEATHPGVYARVNHFLPWILKNSAF